MDEKERPKLVEGWRKIKMGGKMYEDAKRGRKEDGSVTRLWMPLLVLLLLLLCCCASQRHSPEQPKKNAARPR